MVRLLSHNHDSEKHWLNTPVTAAWNQLHPSCEPSPTLSWIQMCAGRACVSRHLKDECVVSVYMSSVPVQRDEASTHFPVCGTGNSKWTQANSFVFHSWGIENRTPDEFKLGERRGHPCRKGWHQIDSYCTGNKYSSIVVNKATRNYPSYWHDSCIHLHLRVKYNLYLHMSRLD